MEISRKDFLKGAAGATGLLLLQPATVAAAKDSQNSAGMAMLIDVTKCVNCWWCYAACKECNQLQETIKNHCFDIIRKKGSQEMMDFRKELIETVLKIVQSDNPIISMRKEIIHTIHSDTLNRTFFLEKFKDRRQELYDAFNEKIGNSEILNCDGTTSVIVIWSEALCVILRMLQHTHFEKVGIDDWFSRYCKGYSIYTEMLFEGILKLKNKEDCSIDGITFPVAKRAIEQFQQNLIGEVIGGISESRPPEE